MLRFSDLKTKAFYANHEDELKGSLEDLRESILNLPADPLDLRKQATYALMDVLNRIDTDYQDFKTNSVTTIYRDEAFYIATSKKEFNAIKEIFSQLGNLAKDAGRDLQALSDKYLQPLGQSKGYGETNNILMDAMVEAIAASPPPAAASTPVNAFTFTPLASVPAYNIPTTDDQKQRLGAARKKAYQEVTKSSSALEKDRKTVKVYTKQGEFSNHDELKKTLQRSTGYSDVKNNPALLGKTKHRVIASKAHVYALGTGDPVGDEPFECTVVSGCAPNLRINYRAKPENPSDHNTYIGATGALKQDAYRATMKEIWHNLLFAANDQGSQLVITPLLGCGAYTRSLSDNDKKIAAEIVIATLNEVWTSGNFSNLKGLVLSIPIDEGPNKTMQDFYFDKAKATLNAANSSVSHGDILTIAQTYEINGIKPAIVNPSSDHVIGGGYLHSNGDINTNVQALEEQLSHYTNLARVQDGDLNPKVLATENLVTIPPLPTAAPTPVTKITASQRQALINVAQKVKDTFEKISQVDIATTDPEHDRKVETIIKNILKHYEIAKKYCDNATDPTKQTREWQNLNAALANVDKENLDNGILNRGAGTDQVEAIIKLQEAVVAYIKTAPDANLAMSVTPTTNTKAAAPSTPTSTSTPTPTSSSTPTPTSTSTPTPTSTSTPTPTSISTATSKQDRQTIRKETYAQIQNIVAAIDVATTESAAAFKQTKNPDIEVLEQILTLFQAALTSRTMKTKLIEAENNLLSKLDQLILKTQTRQQNTADTAIKAKIKTYEDALVAFKTEVENGLDLLKKQRDMIEVTHTTKEIEIPAGKTYKEIVAERLGLPANTKTPAHGSLHGPEEDTLVGNLDKSRFYWNKTKDTEWTERTNDNTYHIDIVRLGNDINPAKFWNQNLAINKFGINEAQFDEILTKIYAAKQPINQQNLASRLQDLVNTGTVKIDPTKTAKALMEVYDKKMTQTFNGKTFPADSILLLAMRQVERFMRENPHQPIYIDSGFSKEYVIAVAAIAEMFNDKIKLRVINESQYDIPPKKGVGPNRYFTDEALAEYSKMIQQPSKQNTLGQAFNDLCETSKKAYEAANAEHGMPALLKT